MARRRARHALVHDLLDKALGLHASPLLAGLDADALVSLAELSRARRVPAGQVLFTCGQDAAEAYIVVSGRLELADENNSEESREEAGPGECIGELPALTGAPRVMTAIALVDSEVLELPPDVLLDLLADHPEVVRAFAERLSARVRGAGAR
ncbi:MAG: Crp/Fnr family transcriptional regulator [Deltaproteobacteria bacterium]|nr:Crp/Fnr family transcriptional regulator [Deltaproteobacteria bacterium]